MRGKKIILKVALLGLVLTGSLWGRGNRAYASAFSPYDETVVTEEGDGLTEDGENLQKEENPDSFLKPEGDENSDMFPGEGGEYEFEEETIPPADMTNVSLETTGFSAIRVGGGYWGSSKEFPIKVKSDVLLEDGRNVSIRLESSNEEMYFDYFLQENVLTLSTYSSGKTQLKIIMNEKEFLVDIEIKEVFIEENNLILGIGEKKKVKVKGGKGLTFKWKSSKSGVVSVDSGGQLKAKKEGNAVITAEIDGEKMGFIVSVVPKIKKKIVKWAVEYSSKSKYSQPKRMQKGFFDCSSLVWKAYHKFGYKLADASYAPTAADLCKHYEMKRKKELVKGGAGYENLETLKFLPGDLMFAGGENNKRHKGIYHVEMVSGYSFYGLNEDGTPSVGLNFIRTATISPDLPVVRPRVKA